MRDFAAIVTMLEATDRLRDDDKRRRHVTQLEHACQVATRALEAGANDDIIVVALLHDVGKLIDVTRHATIATELFVDILNNDQQYLLRNHSTHVALFHHNAGRGRFLEHVPAFAAWNYASFDPSFPTLPLATFLPYLHRACYPPPTDDDDNLEPVE